MSEHIKKVISDGVMRLTIARSSKKNALTMTMYDALIAGFDEASNSDEVRVVLLDGDGGCFTAGNDLIDFMNSPPKSEKAPVFRFLRIISQFEKPIVAAVSGIAIGIGTTMLLHCDIVLAAPSAYFMMPFTKLALVPEAASSLLFPMMVGHQRAAALLMLGDSFGAEEAFQIGVVSKLVEEDALEREANRAARKLAMSPPASIRLTKKLLKSATREAVQRSMGEEGAIFMERLQSPEAAEAFQAFVEKRTPDFSKC